MIPKVRYKKFSNRIRNRFGFPLKNIFLKILYISLFKGFTIRKLFNSKCNLQNPRCYIFRYLKKLMLALKEKCKQFLTKNLSKTMLMYV